MLNATGVLGYVRGKNQTTGDNLYNIMPLNLKLALIQKVGNWGNRLEVQLVDAKSNISSVRNEVKTSGYGLMNLRTSYDMGKVRIDAGIDNLFNQLYSLPLGGAYTGQGKTMSTNEIPYGVAVPGMGRSLSTSLTIKF
jgi:iron complex outermembrane receptor protein